MKSQAWKMFAVRLSEVFTDPGENKLTSKNNSSIGFLGTGILGIKVTFLPVSPGERGTKAAEKSLRCCLAQAVQWLKFLGRVPKSKSHGKVKAHKAHLALQVSKPAA